MAIPYQKLDESILETSIVYKKNSCFGNKFSIFLAFSICINFILEFLLVFLNPNDILDLQICWVDPMFKSCEFDFCYM